MRAGIILAGGRSTRFGDADKAVADLGGVPMIRRVADRIDGVVDELVVNCRDDQTAAIEQALAGGVHDPTLGIDEEPDRGPMAGIATGLRATTGTYAVVVACDMPFVDPALVKYLFDRAVDVDADAAVPRPDEWFQTTQAVYRRDAMLRACEAALARGKGRVTAALFNIDYVVVDNADIEEHSTLKTFQNLNTHEEFAAAQAEF